MSTGQSAIGAIQVESQIETGRCIKDAVEKQAAMPWRGVLLQVLFSAMGGVGYAAVRIRTGSIWPAIALHALYDLAFRVGNLEPGAPLSNAFYMLHGVGLVAFALVVLRPRARRGAFAA